MAKKDETFNIDDLDWPDLDFDEPQEQPDNRNPVTKVAKGAVRAGKKIAFDEGRIRRVAKDVLPGSHSNVAEAAFGVKDILSDVYGNLEGEAYKTKIDLQRSLRRFQKQTKGMFGASVDKILTKLGGEEGYYANQESETERRQRQMDADVAAVFGAEIQANNERREQDEAKNLRNELVGKRRYANQMEVFHDMAGSLKRISDSTIVDWRYKKKTLELQLQQNMLMGDMLTGLGELKNSLVEQLGAIVKNTGLPEAAKIELTEEFKRVNAQKLMESLGGGIYGGLGDYLARTGKSINKRITSTVGNKLRDIRMGMTGGLDAAGDMIKMQAEQAKYGEDDTIETIMELAGGILADKAVGRWGGKVKGKLGGLNFFKNSRGMMDNVSTQGARLLNQQAGLRGTHDGFKGSALDFFRSLLDRTTLNTGLGGITGGPTTDFDEVKMRKLSTRTIVTIIPGLLARIHHEAVKTRTGDDSVPMIRFNSETGVFTDSKTSVAKVRDALVAKGMAKANTEAVDKIIDQVVDKSQLTPSMRLMMRNHIAHLNMRQLPFDPKALATGKMQIFGEGDAADKAKLRRLIGDHYGVDRQGNISGNKDEYQGRVADSARQIQSMRYNLNDPRKQVVDLIESGNIEELLAIGAVVERNGQMLIDFDKINEMRFNEGLGQGADFIHGAFAPKGVRKLDGKVINNIRNSKTVNNTSTGGWNAEDRYNSQYQSLALEELIDQINGGKTRGVWDGDKRYNDEYQTANLEEIVDVLKQGQELSSKQFDALNASVQALMNKGTDAEENYNFQYQTMVLEEIMDILQDGRQFTQTAGSEGALPGLIQRGRGAVTRGLNRLRGIKLPTSLKGLQDGFMKRFNAGRNLATDLLGKGRKRAEGLYERVRDKAKDTWTDVSDWYREGDWRPALEARKLAARAYYDSVTGKVVTRLSEVKGDIMERTADGRAQIALRYEELMEGLRNGEGKKWVAKKVSGARDFASGMFNKALGRHAATKDRIMDSAKSLFGRGKSMLFGMPDVYVKGEIKPRLLAALAKAGNYLTVGGKSVRTLNDITGPVSDLVGNVILSAEDIAAGLVDADGEPLEKFAKGLRGLAQRLTSIPGNLKAGFERGKRRLRVGVKRGVRRVRNFFKGLGGILKGFTGGLLGKFQSGISMISGGDKSTEEEHLDVAYAQLEVQGMILDQLVASKKGRNKKGKWDSDGDGNIDGSWRDLLSKRAKKKEEGAKEEKKPSKVGNWIKDNLFKLVGVIGTGITMLGTKIMKGIKWLGTIMALKNAGKAIGGLGDMGDGGRNRRRRGRPGRGGPRRAPRVGGGGKAALIGGLLSAVAPSAFGSAFGGDEEDEGGGFMDMAGDAALGAGAGWALNKGLDMVDTASTISTASRALGALNTASRVATMASWAARVVPLLANPYVLAGVAVAAVGYGLYKWWDSSKPRPLQAIRLAQYGIDRDNGDSPSRYLEFEEWVQKNSKTDGMGRTSLKGVKGSDVLTAMQDTIGGTEENPEAAYNWFTYRFTPVFSAWMKAANKVGKGDKLASLDDDLSSTQAKEVYDAIKVVPAQSRQVGLPNPDDKTLGPKEVADAMARHGALIDEDAKKDEKSSPVAPEAKMDAATKTLADAPRVGDDDVKKYTGIAGVASGPVSRNDMMDGFKSYADPNNNPSSFDKLRIQDGPVDALRSVRMRVYGLDKLSLPLVNAIIRLECDMIGDIKYSGKNVANYVGNVSATTENAMAYFGVDTRNPQATANFTSWMQNRFMPAYLTFLGAAREAGVNQPLRAHMNGTMTQQYFAGNAMVAASVFYRGGSVSVWKTGLHPILGETPNSNPGSIVGNMEALLAKVDQSELAEISGEKGGILSKAEKFIEGFTDKLTNLKNKVVQKATSWLPDSIGNKIKGWLGADGPNLGDGSATPATPSSGMNVPGGSYTPQMGGGSAIGVNFDPNGGPGGNVNDVPLPTQPKGFEGHMALIAKVAEMTGFDPAMLAGLFASESGFDSRARPGKGTAKGLGQFIDGTWETMVKRHGAKFGIKPGTSPNDPRANALMTVMYMMDNANDLKKNLGMQNPTDVDIYMAHFLGSGGYTKMYKNPDAIGAQLMPTEASYNENVFWVDGDRRRPRTGRQIIEFMGNRHIQNRNRYGPLMQAYIKKQGGKVDESLFTNQGQTLNVSAPQGGATKTDSAPVTNAANDPSLNPAPTSDKDKLAGKSMMKVDAGGVPEIPPSTAPTGVSGASAANTTAASGSDVTTPPSAPVGNGPSLQQVKEDTKKRADSQQSSVNGGANGITAAAGDELVRLAGLSEGHLKLISEGIGKLVELSNQPGPGGQRPFQVPNGPMRVKSQSSV